MRIAVETGVGTEEANRGRLREPEGIARYLAELDRAESSGISDRRASLLETGQDVRRETGRR